MIAGDETTRAIGVVIAVGGVVAVGLGELVGRALIPTGKPTERAQRSAGNGGDA
jgi:hypothetical protein